MTEAIDRFEAAGLARLPGLTHGFFGRRGGVSAGIYASLNAGPGSGDDPAHVAANRDRIARNLDASRLVTAYQVHGTGIVHASAVADDDSRPKGDILVSAEPGLAIGVLTADCAPLLLADAHARIVAAAHAGWRGAAAGVVEHAVAEMERLGASRRRIHAAVGPAIGANAYQVGPEVRAAFLARAPVFARHFRADPAEAGKFRFDLAGAVAADLERAGVGDVEALGLDTYKDSERFFSYRRAVHLNEADYGRQLSAIALA